MAATLESIADTLAKQNDDYTKLGTAVATLTEGHAKLEKSLQALPADYSNIVKIAATVKDPTEEGRFGGHIKSMGHFLFEVRNSRLGQPSEALRKAYDWYEKDGLSKGIDKAIVGSNETFGTDGGFLVAPEFSKRIFERVYKDAALWPKCDNYTVSGNNMTFPRTAETSRANGSRWGGVIAKWIDEGGAGTLTKPTFGKLRCQLNKLMVLSAITSELADDQAILPEYTLRVCSKEIDFMISDAIIRGTGAGQPEGILNAPCKVTVAKESGQAAKTIVPQNIVKMFERRFPGSSSGNLVWLYNQDCENQLHLMTLPIGIGGVTTMMPPGGLSVPGYRTLLGVPTIPIEQAETLGTEGDIMLVDLSQYVTIGKGGINSAMSIHFYFDTDQMAYRMTIRLDGHPWWPSALSPYKGTNTLSPVITLATRA